VSLPFSAGFVLARHGHVILSQQHPRLLLDVAVSARTELVASSSDSARVVIRELPGPFIGQASPDLRRFEIRAANEPSPPFADAIVTLLDPSTGQEESVTVSYVADALHMGDDARGELVAVESDGRHAQEPGAFGLKPIDALMLAVFLFISALLVLAVRCLFSGGRPAGPMLAVANGAPVTPAAPSAFAYTPGSATPYKHSSPFRNQPPTFLASAALRGRGPSPTAASPIVSNM
jgi:hypothetical protein